MNYPIYVDRDGNRMFVCDCGHSLPVDSMTKCSRCSAHYELHITKTTASSG